MTTKIWGPSLWKIIHFIAKKYPLKPNVRDKNITYQLFKYLALVIPCSHCQKHYITFFTNKPPNLNSSPELFQWTVKLHNNVNKINKKKIIGPKIAFRLNNGITNKEFDNLIKYLYQESNKGSVSKDALIKLVNCLKYLLSKKGPIQWMFGNKGNIVIQNQDVFLSQIHT